MTTTYAPAGFGVTSSIGPHQGLRVTFAETRSLFTPDAVEAADLTDNVNRLVDTLSSGSYDIEPASSVTVAPGEEAATVDFAVVGGGTVNVGDAVAQLHDALYGPLSFLQRTYIRSVELLGDGGTAWGDPIRAPAADTETSLSSIAGGALGLGLLAAGIVALFVFSPEIKMGIHALGGRKKG